MPTDVVVESMLRGTVHRGRTHDCERDNLVHMGQSNRMGECNETAREELADDVMGKMDEGDRRWRPSTETSCRPLAILPRDWAMTRHFQDS
jgi:hypothetical protein